MADRVFSNNVRRPKKARYKTHLAQIAGAWKDWDDKEFNAFLDTTRQIRKGMFADREFSPNI